MLALFMALLHSVLTKSSKYINTTKRNSTNKNFKFTYAYYHAQLIQKSS
jgi:hypothetical protein